MKSRIIKPIGFFLLACFIIVLYYTGSEKLIAGPHFPGEPGNMATHPLVYEDTTLPEFQNIIQKLDSFYSVQVRGGFNGNVLIGKEGKVFYERYFGYSNRESGQRMQSNSASQLASVSKTFTGVAILYLYQHNYLNIGDPVQSYFPDFPYPNITIKMLLSHRSGIPDYTKWVGRYRKDFSTPISNNDMMGMFAKYKPALEFRPDSRFKYSNSNYAILASLIEKVSEMDYTQFMQHYIFEPIGLHNTFVYSPTYGLPSSAAKSYKYNWMREQDMFADGVHGDKGIYSTVRDMYRWDQSFYNNTLLDDETQQLAYGPCSFEKPGLKNYGLGWRMLCYPSGNKVIYHNGWWHGNNTVFYRFIKENMTIIVLGNKYNNKIYQQPKVLYSLIKNVPVDAGFDEEE